MPAELEFLQSLIDADEQPVFALDHDLRYTAFNLAHSAAMRTLYGAEIALGGRLLEYQTVAADRETAQANLRRALEGERVVASAVAGDDGRRRVFEVVHTPRALDDGTIAGVVVHAREILVPRDTEDLCAAFFENSLEGFAYCRMLYDGAGRPDDFTYLAVNPAFGRLTGLTDVVGKRITELLPTVGDESPEIFALYARVAETGEPAEFEIDFAPLGRWLRISASRPEPGHFVAVFGDVSETKRAENTLNESEERHRSLVETMIQGIVYHDADGSIVAANPAAERILGLTLDQMQGSTPTDLLWRTIHEDGSDFPGAEHPAMVALRTGREVRYVVMGIFNSATAACRWITVNAVPQTRPGEDKPYRVFATFVDNTESKRTERALRATKAMRDQAEAIAHVGSVTWDLATQRASWSPEMFRLFAVDPAEFDGDSSIVFEQRMHPNDRGRLEDAYARALATGRVSPADFSVVWPDGSTHMLHGEGTTEYDGDGNPVAIVGYFQDVSERRAAEAALRTSEARLSTIFRAAHEAMVLEARDGSVLAFNAMAEELTGLSAASITGRPLAAGDLAPIHEDGTPWAPEDRPSLQTLTTGQPQNDVIMGFERGDGVRWVNMNTAPVFRREEDDASAVVVTFSDVTGQRLAEEEIRRLNAELAQRVVSRTEQRDAATKELEAFAYSVAHDVRTPLRAIDGFSVAILENDGERLSADSIESLERARLAAQRMARLLDDLLGLSRVSRMEMLRTRVDLSAIARDVGAELEARHPERCVELAVADGLVAHADSALVRMILLELLGNAWKFTSKHGTAQVAVGATDVGGERVFFVRDDGAGFEMRYADHLFGAFQRMHPSDDFEGHGVGLATVQRLVIRHGGRVWAEAEVEKGATFSFTLQDSAGAA